VSFAVLSGRIVFPLAERPWGERVETAEQLVVIGAVDDRALLLDDRNSGQPSLVVAHGLAAAQDVRLEDLGHSRRYCHTVVPDMMRDVAPNRGYGGGQNKGDQHDRAVTLDNSVVISDQRWRSAHTRAHQDYDGGNQRGVARC
jgi:hypothetical protein